MVVARRSSSYRIGSAWALLTILALGACASQAPTKTGFLTDYGALQPTRDHPDDPSYRKQGLAAGDYTAFILVPVAFHPADSRHDPDQEAAAALTDDYDKKLRQAFLKRYQEAVSPGPGVMLI